MKSTNPNFVSFEKYKEEFKAFITLDDAFCSNKEFYDVLKKAVIIYRKSINKLKYIICEIDKLRKNRILIPAFKIWQLGDAIFELKAQLEGLDLQLDGVYDHLTRDLKVKKKWLEKVIIFRRYIPEIKLIPKDLNWGKCEKGTRRIAESLKHNTS